MRRQMPSPGFLNLSALEQTSRFESINSQGIDHLKQALSRPNVPSKYSVSHALMAENQYRNRYSNVFPWDSTRVVLRAEPGFSDYINASWVQLGANRYIAAQGPLKNTIHHFWAMCFQQAEQQDSADILIAMVTPLCEQGREKCAKYWPSSDESEWDLSSSAASDGLFTTMKVKWLEEEITGDTLVTRLEVECNGVRKNVLHHHFKGWADTKKPSTPEPLIELSKHIVNAKSKSPNLVPIVHCSAGVGRTGTFIAIDHFLTSNVLRSDVEDPVWETVSKMREHRMLMVQTVSQFMFLYDAARDALAE